MTSLPASAQDLGIDLSENNEDELFKWLLASLLFGKPIQRQIASRAYETLTREGITTLGILLKTKWKTLVSLLDEAHYVRYDFSTATKLLEVAKLVKNRYGTVGGLIKSSENLEGLEKNLVALKGIGPVTASIFIKGISPFSLPQKLNR